MSNLYKTTRTDEGITTEQGNITDDIVSNGGRTTNANGTVILSNDEHIFIPDTYNDRVAIIDATIGLCDAIVSNNVGTYINSAGVSTPLVMNPNYISAINQIKSNLQQIKKDLV